MKRYGVGKSRKALSMDILCAKDTAGIEGLTSLDSFSVLLPKDAANCLQKDAKHIRVFNGFTGVG
jgi:hypothetical protein